MWKVIRNIFILFSLGLFAVASAQLPPKIMADKHLIHAEQLYETKDYVAAFEVMGKIIALQKEHNLALSDKFHFRYAQISLAVDSLQIALESVTRYLSATEDEGEFYEDALALLLKAEGNEVLSAEDFYNEVIKTEGTCKGLPKGSSCWMELTNHPECYAWNPYLQESETWTWSGKCSGHMPEGKGTLTVNYISRYPSLGRVVKESIEYIGSFQKSKKHGKWVSYSESDSGYRSFSETTYVNGILHGYWSRNNDNNPDFRASEGIYLDGKVPKFLTADGRSISYYWHGYRRTDWSVEEEGPDENGNGHLTYRNSDGDVWGGPYVNGKQHGKWIERSFWYLDEAKDTVGEGSYVEGWRHGKWVYRDPNGTVRGGPYVNGKQHGKWVNRIYYFSGDFYKGFIGEGSYVDGQEHGQWVYRHPNGDILKAEYIDGYGQYPILWYDYSEEKCWSVAGNDKKKKINKKMCLE